MNCLPGVANDLVSVLLGQAVVSRSFKLFRVGAEFKRQPHVIDQSLSSPNTIAGEALGDSSFAVPLKRLIAAQPP